MTEFNKWVGETTEAINVRLESIGDPYDLDELTDAAYWKVLCVAAFGRSVDPRLNRDSIDSAILEGLECRIRDGQEDDDPKSRHSLKKLLEENQ